MQRSGGKTMNYKKENNMSKMFARFCTNPNCQDEHPEPIMRSKGWAYCRPCYIRIYPAAALRKGIAKVDHPVVEKNLAIQDNRKKAEKVKAYLAKQPTLFDGLEGGK
jgi:hypothetical protein